MIIGIAGKACSGKNAAASYLDKKGFITVDVDRLGHSALEENKEAVIRHFGRQYLSEDGRIDRKALGALVFGDRDKLRELEAITHPAVILKVKEIINAEREKNLVINAAILGPSGLDTLCDKILWIESPLILRILRAFKRDNKKLSHIFSRIRSQRDLTVQHFSAGVDIYMVRNRGSLADLERQIEIFFNRN